LPLLRRLLHAPLLRRPRARAREHVRRLRRLRRHPDSDQLPGDPAREPADSPGRLQPRRPADERLDVLHFLRLPRGDARAGGDAEAVCLSTCNRTELYVAGPGIEQRAGALLAAEADGVLYRRRDDAAARHLFRVAAGLDSRVQGETEILGQVRAAYALGAPGPLLDRLFREALRVGRKVRTQAQVGDPGASAASAAAVLAERVLGDLTD